MRHYSQQRYNRLIPQKKSSSFVGSQIPTAGLDILYKLKYFFLRPALRCLLYIVAIEDRDTFTGDLRPLQKYYLDLSVLRLSEKEEQFNYR